GRRFPDSSGADSLSFLVKRDIPSPWVPAPCKPPAVAVVQMVFALVLGYVISGILFCMTPLMRGHHIQPRGRGLTGVAVVDDDRLAMSAVTTAAAAPTPRNLQSLS